ncbi:DNA primase [Austwickia chelonae]|uniref:DNA primase n=1 Tax=Austwickia chelonae NBRC 105200 TaxID=1184607 RepID=K6VQB9_9MICO|nr:DNA primase [Austwickia chelonae]GAB77545.1 DNA primase [Austwickia chelonae NBRC 105200]SEW12591.1 DNA primase [Austwickia chelonae]
MAGLIKDEDVQAVKERANLEEVVGEYVTLRRAGIGSLKGLCPFHDEKTPSFTVRPSVGSWHCFGCGEGGDVITFVQKIDHLSFVEAVERLAEKSGIVLRYEDGERPREEAPGRRTRLVEAHRVAEEFYAAALLNSKEARTGRDFLRGRDFDSQAATRFGVGYAPRQGEALVAHLRGKGFTEEELVLSGLVGRGSRGLYDRFRGRLVWPIREITGDTVGFGARRLFDDDRIQAKYLNTSETPIYKKTSVLYGLDLAKKAISRERTAVIVEGYTDVMACHLAGVETAVATCGTSFGVDHIKMLRRIMRDEAGGVPARAVFTFDGDEAGQKAAMRAFDEDQRWTSQCYVAVADAGQDPCELRLSGGELAVRGLIEDAVPMFEFAIRTVLARHDLSTVEGRVAGMRAVAPVIAGIRDRSLHHEYVRTVSGRIGVDIEQLAREVARADRQRSAGTRERIPPGAAPLTPQPPSGPTGPDAAAEVAIPPPDMSLPAVFLAAQFLQLLLQYPRLLPADEVARIEESSFAAPAHRVIFESASRAGLATAERESAAAWVDRLAAGCPPEARQLVVTLSVAEIHARRDPGSGEPDQRYVDEIVFRMRELGLRRAIDDATVALRRQESTDPEGARAQAIELTRRQQELARLRERYS